MKTHWKQLTNPDYIGAYSLVDSQDLNVTIDKVVREMVTGNAGKKEECTVAYLVNQKPFILNKTNCKTIQKIANSPFIEDWKGLTITLFATTTNLKGETVECLRVRPIAPKKIDLEPFKKQLTECKTLQELQSVYTSKGFPSAELVGLKDELKLKLK